MTIAEPLDPLTEVVKLVGKGYVLSRVEPISLETLVLETNTTVVWLFTLPEPVTVTGGYQA